MTLGIRWLIALALLLTWQVSAMASTVWQVDFVLTVEETLELPEPPPAPGSYVQPSLGEQFFGQIVYDSSNLTGIGSEQMMLSYYEGAYGGPFVFGILSTTVNYYTEQITERDSEASPWLPLIYFQDGVFQGMRFGSRGQLGLIDILDDQFKIYWSPSGDPPLARGSVSYGTPMAIPTPAVAGAGLSLLTVLGLKRRRRVA